MRLLLEELWHDESAQAASPSVIDELSAKRKGGNDRQLTPNLVWGNVATTIWRVKFKSTVSSADSPSRRVPRWRPHAVSSSGLWDAP
jgi:hypothetical protein